MKRLLLILGIILLLAGQGWAGIVIDGNSATNDNSEATMYHGGVNGKAQSFTGDGSTIVGVRLYLGKVGSPTGSASVLIKNDAGATYGTNSKPGATLYTSGTISDVTVLNTTDRMIDVSVTPYTTTVGTHYCVAIIYDDAGSSSSNKIQIGTNSGSTTHAGNAAYTTDAGTTWTSQATDCCFMILTTAPPITQYVRTDGSDTAYGVVDSTDATSGAKLTFAAAQKDAANGDYVKFKTGTYSANNTYTRQLTIGPTDAGTYPVLDGSQTFSNAAATPIVINALKYTATGLSGNPIAFSNNSAVTLNDVIVGPSSATGKITYTGGTHVWNRCTWDSLIVTSTGLPAGSTTDTNASTVTYNYCNFKPSSGNHAIGIAGCTWTYNNCLGNSVSSGNSSPFMSISNNVVTTGAFKNTVILGTAAVSVSGTNNVVTADNCWWQENPGMSSLQTVFAAISGSLTTERATVTSSYSYVDPGFKTFLNTSLGRFLLRRDDRNNLSISITDCAILNPEVVINHCVDIHSVYNGPSAQDVADMRTLINAGNEISFHGSVHADSSSLNAFTASTSAGTVTLAISGTRTGDSDTWTGTAVLTVDGTPETKNLGLGHADNMDTIGKLRTWLNGVHNGRTISTGTVTNQPNSQKALCLADQTTTITTNTNITLDSAAFVKFEWAEGIADLEAYVKTGKDRNGNNDTTAGNATGTAASYVCRTIATPYDNYRAAVLTDATSGLLTNANLYGGWACSTANGDAMFFKAGSLTSSASSLYGFASNTNATIPSVDNCILANIYAVKSNALVKQVTWHGSHMTYNGTTANLKTLLVSYGVANQTLSQVLGAVIANADFTIAKTASDYTYMIDWTKRSTYINLGDYHISPGSALVKKGTQVVGYSGTDYYGGTIHNLPNIGLDDTQLSGGGLSLGLGVSGGNHRPQ